MKKLLKYLIRVIGVVFLVVLGYGVLNYKSAIPLETLKKKYAPAPSQFMDLDGMQVHYRDEGNQQDSMPIVLIHGTSSSLHTWQGWVDALKGERRVIRFDLPGFGLTGPNGNGDYSLRSYSKFTNDVLEKLHVGQCVVAGNSLGGEVAWHFAMDYPGKVSRLILVDAAGYPMVSKSTPLAFTIARTPILNNFVKYVTPRNLVERGILDVYGDKSKVTPELVDRYYELALRDGNRQALVDRLVGSKKDSDYLKMGSLSVRTLVLWGAEDMLIPESQGERFHSDLPNDTLVVMKGLGHVPMEEDAEATVMVVKSFLGAH